MTDARHLDPRTTAWQLTDEVLVVCPACSQRAVVLAAPPGPDVEPQGDRLRCLACGLARSLSPAGGGPASAPPPSYRGLPLWLTASCCGHTLWAYSLRHVELLEAIVGARLRERRRDPALGWRNASVASRLPRWVLAAGHRDEVLRALGRLRLRAG